MAKFLPPTDGISLSERECSKALKLGKQLEKFKGDFDRLAELVKIELLILPTKLWPDELGLILRRSGKRKYRCIMTKNTKLSNTLSFGHELHHFYFGKICRSSDLKATEKNKSEGKAAAFAAIIVMPLLPEDINGELLEQHIYQRFGPRFKEYARYRIVHFYKHGW